MNLHHKTNVNEAHAEQMSRGDRIADAVASVIGSWHFIITQAFILLLWFTFNSVAWFYHFDGYPFILCNLFMSAEAAFATPLVLMSQNRQADKDRIAAEVDYAVNRKAEEHTEAILNHLDAQDQQILAIVQMISTKSEQRLDNAQSATPRKR